jgi:hypothetical protein
MARPRFMLPGNECIDDPQACERADLQRRDRATGSDATVVRRCVFERSNHRRSDSDDAPAPPPRRVDGIRCSQRNLVRLGKREHCIETRVASRGNPGGMSQRRECRASRAKVVDEPPIKEKTRGWSFEGDRAAGDRRPRVPQRQWSGEIRVLNRTAVPRQPFPNLLTRTLEPDLDQARMLQDLSYDGTQRTELQGITYAERRRKRPGSWSGLGLGCASIAGSNEVNDLRRRLIGILDATPLRDASTRP